MRVPETARVDLARCLDLDHARDHARARALVRDFGIARRTAPAFANHLDRARQITQNLDRALT